MNAKIRISLICLLIVVTSCNRRYSSRDYIKGDRVHVESRKLIGEDNKPETANLPAVLYPEVDSFMSRSEGTVPIIEKTEEAERDHWTGELKTVSKVLEKEQYPETEDIKPKNEPQRSKKGLGIASMVLGILSILMLLAFPLFALVLAIVAVILGAIAIKDPDARGMAIAGLVTGLVTLAIFFFVFLLVLAVFL